ncbi:MAG: aspartyl/asparaginyl beta-hydroxylase domain-containing protein [Bacteroidetes bacterium]|nr:aspartyl/asparaginyl beta-hydroxylase domain-containing protein [Bacteroidota bacterium]
MEFTKKNPKYFYSLDEHPQLRVLEEHFSVVLEELNTLRKQVKGKNWFESFPHYLKPESKNKWQVFSFLFFGIKHPDNCNLCPKTAGVLNKIPNLVSADFSYLPAHTQIKPHKGFTRMVLRVHLGLIIPDNCGIRVGSDTKKWEEGKLLVFDDSFEHEAWNNSNQDRFVLMLDIANPLWGYSAHEINKYKIENMEDTFMLNMFSKEQWLSFFEKGEFPSLNP